MIRSLEKYQSDLLREDEFKLYELQIPAGTRYPLHWHEYLEFEIIISGQAEHIYNNSTYLLQPGTAYMMCYYDFHALTAVTDVTLYSLHFNKSMLPPDFAGYLDFNQFHCRLSDMEMQRVLHRLQELSDEADHKFVFRNQIIRNIISEIVILMVRKAVPEKMLPTPLPVQQAIAFMNEHFLLDITLEELAKKLSFSPNYLGKLFKNQIGFTFHEYLHILRLKYACSLLQTSNMPVKEIAFASGYNSVEYFLYVFKQKMLLTPNEYRKQFAQN